MPQLMKMPTKNIRYIAVDIDNIMTNAHKTPQEAKDSMQEVYQSVSNYQGKNKIVEVRIIEVNLAFEPDETIYDDIYGDSLYMHPELYNMPTTIDYLLLTPEKKGTANED